MPIEDLNLTRLTFDLEESLVTVIALKDIPDLRLDRINIRLLKDKESDVPLWVAEVLEENGVAIIKEDHTVSHGYMARLAHKEGENRILEEIDSHLYRRVRIHISNLANINTGSALRKKTSIEGNFSKLLRRRFRKILNIVMIDNQLDGNLTLSEEEKWLYKQINQIFNTWQKNVGLASQHMEGNEWQ